MPFCAKAALLVLAVYPNSDLIEFYCLEVRVACVTILLGCLIKLADHKGLALAVDFELKVVNPLAFFMAAS